MIILKKKTATAIASGTTVVPFSELVANTNENMAWDNDNNSITMKGVGWYNTTCTVTVSSTAGSVVTLSVCANGAALEGDKVGAIIGANGSTSLVLPVPVHVIHSDGSAATLGWAITSSATATIDNAIAFVQGVQ